MTEQVDDVALAIALVALLVSFSQLLAALFSTAEGYRRCQESVIGEWAEYSHRRWHETQWRFETMVVTPEFLLAHYSSEGKDSAPSKENADNCAIESGQTNSSKRNSSFQSSFVEKIYDNTTRSIRHKKRSPEGKKLLLNSSYVEKDAEDPKSELVCWIALLQQLHECSKKCTQDIKEHAHSDFPKWEKSLPQCTTWPAIRFKRRSWDFMPPEVVRLLLQPLSRTLLSWPCAWV